LLTKIALILSYNQQLNNHRAAKVQDRKRMKMNRFLRIAAGFIFILLSFTGILIPIVPWVFLFTGLLLLSPEFPLLDRVKRKLKAHFPKFQRIEDRIRQYCRQCI